MSIITENERKIIRKNMEDLLDEYDYEWEESALDKIIAEWASAKSDLIAAFKNHPKYVEGKFCIAFDSDYDREIDPEKSGDFSKYLYGIMGKYEQDIPEAIKSRGKLNYYQLPQELYSVIMSLRYVANRTISQELCETLESCIPEIHPHAGEKTSRVVNRICQYLGYDKDPDYNRKFAKYADSLSPMTIKRHTIISLNPLDYLTMSFGNSWASCHTIDKLNKRNMPNDYHGMYSSGTVSYMLDPSSMVFYTVDKSYDGTDYWTQPKINRQMFHYGENKLVQGRLYPQANDGNADEYAIYRRIVQEVIAFCFDMPNLWTVSKGTENAGKYICSCGTHYRDYDNFDSCTLSKNKEYPNENDFVIGAAPICIECGTQHYIEGSINCCHVPGQTCANCGCVVDDPDELHEIDGRFYCEDCCNYCPVCEEWHRREETYIECEDQYVCSNCLTEYYSWCEDCEEYYPVESTRYIDGLGYVCDNCIENYRECKECGVYHHVDESYRIYGTYEYICEECLRNGTGEYGICDECQCAVPVEDMITADDSSEDHPEYEHLCPDCFETVYKKCDVCGKSHFRQNMLRTIDGWICHACRDRLIEED